MLTSLFLYFVVFIISISISKINSKVKTTTNKLIIFSLSIFLPVLIATIRYKVGTDYMGYYESYKMIVAYCHDLSSILSYYQEPMHVVLNLLAYHVFNSYHGFLFFSSLIFMSFSFAMILNYKDKISVPMAYFIFFMTIYHLSFNCVRQMIAVSIIFYSFKYVYKRNFLKFLLLLLLASMFHKSAFICIFLYFIWLDKGEKTKLFYIIMVLVTLFIPLFQNYIAKICELLGIYGKYTSDNYVVSSSFSFMLYLVPLLILYFINKKESSENSNILRFYFRLYIVQIPMQLLGNYVAFADRLSMYLLPSQIIMIPLLLRTIKYNKSINSFIVICWYLFYYIFMFIFLKSNGVYPYSVFF